MVSRKTDVFTFLTLEHKKGFVLRYMLLLKHKYKGEKSFIF